MPLAKRGIQISVHPMLNVLPLPVGQLNLTVFITLKTLDLATPISAHFFFWHPILHHQDDHRTDTLGLYQRPPEFLQKPAEKVIAHPTYPNLQIKGLAMCGASQLLDDILHPRSGLLDLETGMPTLDKALWIDSSFIAEIFYKGTQLAVVEDVFTDTLDVKLRFHSDPPLDEEQNGCLVLYPNQFV